jgi:hypothetical protein
MASWKDKAWFLPYAALTSLLYLFCAYILDVFLLRNPGDWRTVSDYSIYVCGKVSIGIHFYSGFLLQLILPFQLLPALRRRAMWIHRWLGRAFALLCICVGVGGTTYTLAVGTVGGLPMDVSFTGYGLLMILLPFPTVIFAMKGDQLRHKRWATRLVSVAIGSALYRLYTAPLHFIDIGIEAALLWLNVMAWVFYLPNLIVAEIIIWRVWGYGEAEKADDGARVGDGYISLDTQSDCVPVGSVVPQSSSVEYNTNAVAL